MNHTTTPASHSPSTTSLWPKAFLITLAALFLCGQSLHAEETEPEARNPNLAVLWTSGDPEIAHRVAFMFTYNAKKQEWFDHIQLIIWGPSQRLLVADQDIQAYVKKMQEAGIVVEACITCAKSYGIVEQLEALGLEVKPMGVPLTRFLKSPDWEVLSF